MVTRFSENGTNYRLVVPFLSPKDKKQLYEVFLSQLDEHIYYHVENNCLKLFPPGMEILTYTDISISMFHTYDFHLLSDREVFLFNAYWNDRNRDKPTKRENQKTIYSPIIGIMPEIYNFWKSILRDRTRLLLKVKHAAGMRQLKEYGEFIVPTGKKKPWTPQLFKKLDKLSIKPELAFAEYESEFDLLLTQLVVITGIMGRMYNANRISNVVESFLRKVEISQRYTIDNMVRLYRSIRLITAVFSPDCLIPVEYVISLSAKRFLENDYKVDDKRFDMIRTMNIDWNRYNQEDLDLTKKINDAHKLISKMVAERDIIYNKKRELIAPLEMGVSMSTFESISVLFDCIESEGSKI